MKFRPQMQLRFRDEAQYARVKKLAAKEGSSINNWILMKVEAMHPELKGESKSKLERVLALRGILSHVKEDIVARMIEENRKEREREEAEIEGMR